MSLETILQNPLIYQTIFAFVFVICLNKLLSRRFKEQIVPLIPRVFYVRRERILQMSSPVLFDRLKEFLADLQQKRNTILAGKICLRHNPNILELKNGSMLAEAALAKVRELCEVEKNLNQLLLFSLRCNRINQSRVRVYFNNAKKVLNTYLSVLMKIN